MKLLYIASNPKDANSLMLLREITEMQLRLGGAISTQELEIKFLPEISIDLIASEISRFCPTILHISAHGMNEALNLSVGDGISMPVSATTLSALVAVPRPPTIVYLNACNSLPIAKEISKLVPIAVGTSAPITNRAARASAIRFYELLINGATIQQAHDNSSALLMAMSNDAASTELSSSLDVEPSKIALVDVFEVVARFGRINKPDFTPDENGLYKLYYGVKGCPPESTIITYFTDDNSFEEPCLGYELGPPVKGKYWRKPGFKAYGDFTISAAGRTGAGKSFSTSSTLCDALERFLVLGGYGKLDDEQIKAFHVAVSELRRLDAT